MAILGVWSLAEEFGFPASRNSTLAGSFDATWCDSAIECLDNVAGPTIGVPSSNAGTDIWFHFDVYSNSTNVAGSAADGTWWSLSFSGGSAWYVRADLNNGNVEYGESINSNFSGQVILTPISTPFALTRMTIDIRVRVNSGGNDIVDIYHNGALYGTLSRATRVGRVDSLSLRNFDSEGSIYYSQFILADESTLGMRHARMQPDSAGAHTAFDGDFNSVILPFDGQAISGNVIGDRESWNLEAYPGPASPAGIRSVLQTSYASLGGSAVPGGYEHFLRVGGVDYDGAKITPVPGTQGITEWTTNPSTSASWDTADLAALIAGVEAVA